MSDSELEAIKRKKMLELQKKFAVEQKKKERETESLTDPDKALDRVFKYRAWEVFNAACDQYPQVMKKVKEALVKMVSSGEVKEIDGEQLLVSLRNIGLDVRLETEIRFLKKGESKTLSQKLEEVK
jgi:programmed cell death protein 5